MKKLYECICNIEVLLARGFLVIMVVLIFGAGIARLIAHPMNWAIDIATCLFAWACFFCADIAFRKNRLMSVEVVTSRLNEKGRKVCRMINYFILVAFLTYLIIAGTWLSYVSRARAFQGIPEFSFSWVTMSLPIGSALLLITTVLKISQELRGVPSGD
jgi:TRAP-type C4-dicarboxylate transport system permease small subunit